MMGRYFAKRCPDCGVTYMQDWEEPDECPYCNGEPEEYEPDNMDNGY